LLRVVVVNKAKALKFVFNQVLTIVNVVQRKAVAVIDNVLELFARVYVCFRAQFCAPKRADDARQKDTAREVRERSART
jgi:hypothetical protein